MKFLTLHFILFTAVILSLFIPLKSYCQINVLTGDSLRQEVPIMISYEGKTVTPYINITINNRVYQGVFDTGSYGVRILGGALGNAAADLPGQRVKYSYGDGAHALFLQGSVSVQNIQVGKLSSPVKVMKIDSAKYGPNNPWIAIGDSALIQSNHFRGLPAIIGVGLRYSANSKGIASPLGQLPGNHRFIVKLPRFGGGKGKLIINPNIDDASGFTMFHLKPGRTPVTDSLNSWLDNELAGTIYVNGGSVKLPTMIDSGAPNFQVYSKQFKGRQSIPSGNNVQYEITDLNDPSAVIKSTFQVSSPRRIGQDYVNLNEAGDKEKSIFGIRTFFEFDILYDLQNGLIGIKRK